MTKTTKVNPDFAFDGLHDKKLPSFFEGADYQIVGPLNHPAENLGILLPKDMKLALAMQEKRGKYKEVFSKDSVDLLSVLYVIQNQPVQAMVDLPPSNYICLESLMVGETKSVAEKILQREQGRKVYKIKPEARDFWVDPTMNRLFVVAVDKLK